MRRILRSLSPFIRYYSKLEIGKIGFIGVGQMGNAFIKGLINTDLISPKNIIASDINENKRKEIQKYGIKISSNKQLVNESDVIILAVKPNQINETLNEIRENIMKKHLIISLAAGVPLKIYQNLLPKYSRIIRVMPNINCLVLESMSVFCMSDQCIKGKDDEITKSLFKAVGSVEECKEDFMNAVTGLSGSGPAFTFMFLEALVDGGVKCGLPREIAQTLAAQTILGSAKLYLESKTHCGMLKDMVASPGGSCIAGIHELEKGGFRGNVMSAVCAATKRSEELGEIYNK